MTIQFKKHTMQIVSSAPAFIGVFTLEGLFRAYKRDCDPLSNSLKRGTNTSSLDMAREQWAAIVLARKVPS